ncbi:MAG: nucleotidyl transferase AbiEii/AbiGii toxin family protein [Kiritimatiellia bacterium]|nr:nucleotidyl transferase AbiEii/AbiGii toxin family protein [Kiritimatiellia bacterium]
MIPESYIRAWQAHAPWRDWVKVEQDLIVCRSVIAIFQHPLLCKHLIFRGGTALHKLFFRSARRYSEDIDLVQIEVGPIGPVFDALRETLAPLLGKLQRKQGPGVVTLTARMISEIPPVTPMKLKVEINTREHFTVLGIRKKSFVIESPWFTGLCEIPTFTLEELLASKLRALYQRRKGRDLFDLWLGLTEGKADPRQIVDIFWRYMKNDRRRISREEFVQNLAKKRLHPAFRTDLIDLLPVGQEYNFEDGFTVLEREILSRL